MNKTLESDFVAREDRAIPGTDFFSRSFGTWSTAQACLAISLASQPYFSAYAHARANAVFNVGVWT